MDAVKPSTPTIHDRNRHEVMYSMPSTSAAQQFPIHHQEPNHPHRPAPPQYAQVVGYPGYYYSPAYREQQQTTMPYRCHPQVVFVPNQQQTMDGRQTMMAQPSMNNRQQVYMVPTRPQSHAQGVYQNVPSTSQPFMDFRQHQALATSRQANQAPPRNPQPLPQQYYRGPMRRIPTPVEPAIVPHRSPEPEPQVPSVSGQQTLWKDEVNGALRNFIKQKIIAAVIPNPPHVADSRYNQFCEYAGKIEAQLFQQATSRLDYYHIVAKKIYHIIKELELKRARRLDGNPASIPQIASPGPFMVRAQLAASPSLERTSTHQSLACLPSNEYSNPPCKKMKFDTPSTDNGTNVMEQHMQGPIIGLPEWKSFQKPPETITSASKPVKDTLFGADALREKLEPILKRLKGQKEVGPFLEPVDAIALGCPDYELVVKKPMDLATVSNKLKEGKYENAWELCDDITLIFENCWLYNRKGTKIYKDAIKLCKLFVDDMNEVMKTMGYCCGEKRQFTWLPILCYGESQCVIKFNQEYMCYENTTKQFKVEISERYSYCLACFDKFVPDQGIMTNESETPRLVPKSEFKRYAHNVVELEPFEACTSCGRKWHSICALHIKQSPPKAFVCPTCREEKQMPPSENKFTASSLPHNRLSDFLEKKVTDFITKRAKDLEVTIPTVVIRVLSAQDKTLEVRKEMKERYSAAGFPESFPYKSKAIFAYQLIEGHEVCFFGMYVQEYGANCGGNNQRRVYISYLDSVFFFEPKLLRTEVYYTMILGYLEYASSLGYTMAHLWACPPSAGDDYIFHCHPAEQKIPKAIRLKEWYCRLLDLGKEQGIVFDYKDIYQQAIDDGVMSPVELPYFEGDLWPGVIEDCIRDVKKEEAKPKIEDLDQEAASPAAKYNGKKKGSKPKKKKKKTAKVGKKQGVFTGNQVMDRVYTHLEKNKESFFTIQLFKPSEIPEVMKKEIQDPDSQIMGELVELRDNFLTKAREEHWEFSSLRRAKFSTMAMCYALHLEEQTAVYACNKCSKDTAQWHCKTCQDFDLCNECKHYWPHEHPLELIVRKDEEERKKRLAEIERIMMDTIHAKGCRDANCMVKGCKKMKKFLTHFKACSLKKTVSCQYCARFMSLCYAHAKQCQLATCQAFLCSTIRQRIYENAQRRMRQAEMMMRRRIEGSHMNPATPENIVSTR